MEDVRDDLRGFHEPEVHWQKVFWQVVQEECIFTVPGVDSGLK
jgi:hypothetical protein